MLLQWFGATGENRNFVYKEDKATMQILNLNVKTIENKHFIQHLKQFLQTLFVCFVLMPTSKRNYQCFLILVQSFSACSFSRIIDCLQYKLSSVWSYIFLLNGPDKKPKQNSSKTKRHSQQQEPKSVGQRTAVSQWNFFGSLLQGLFTDWLVCIACFIFWHLIGSDQLSYFSWIGQFAFFNKKVLSKTVQINP